jgi:branched-chain amino acid transport system ATP-binding protein
VLELTALEVRYGGIAALQGISLSVPEGTVVTLIGANGAGKSTTLRAISGLVEPSAGDITFRGSSIVGLPAERIVDLGIVQVPEGRRVFPELSVDENLRVGAYLVRDKAVVAGELERMYALFPRLAERRKQVGSSLSGGEQQMLAFARALMSRPRLLLLDEPSLGLAPQLIDEVAATVGRIRQEGVTVLLVEQNAHVALNLADRGYILETGRVTISGTGPELLDDPRVQEAYLGAMSSAGGD